MRAAECHADLRVTSTVVIYATGGRVDIGAGQIASPSGTGAFIDSIATTRRRLEEPCLVVTLDARRRFRCIEYSRSAVNRARHRARPINPRSKYRRQRRAKKQYCFKRRSSTNHGQNGAVHESLGACDVAGVALRRRFNIGEKHKK